MQGHNMTTQSIDIKHLLEKSVATAPHLWWDKQFCRKKKKKNTNFLIYFSNGNLNGWPAMWRRVQVEWKMCVSGLTKNWAAAVPRRRQKTIENIEMGRYGMQFKVSPKKKKKKRKWRKVVAGRRCCRILLEKCTVELVKATEHLHALSICPLRWCTMYS